MHQFLLFLLNHHPDLFLASSSPLVCCGCFALLTSSNISTIIYPYQYMSAVYLPSNHSYIYHLLLLVPGDVPHIVQYCTCFIHSSSSLLCSWCLITCMDNDNQPHLNMGKNKIDSTLQIPNGLLRFQGLFQIPNPLYRNKWYQYLSKLPLSCASPSRICKSINT